MYLFTKIKVKAFVKDSRSDVSKCLTRGCRPLAWHDLAFYNADLYEGLRQMMLDAELGKKDETEFAATYCSYFEVSYTKTFFYLIENIF